MVAQGMPWGRTDSAQRRKGVLSKRLPMKPGTKWARPGGKPAAHRLRGIPPTPESHGMRAAPTPPSDLLSA